MIIFNGDPATHEADMTQWLIWSIEHRAWWRPNGNGYTKSRDSAGRYTFKEACRIVREANNGVDGCHPPQEAMVQDEL